MWWFCSSWLSSFFVQTSSFTIQGKDFFGFWIIFLVSHLWRFIRLCCVNADVFLVLFWLVITAKDSLFLFTFYSFFFLGGWGGGGFHLPLFIYQYKYMLCVSAIWFLIIQDYVGISLGGFAFKKKDSRCSAAKRVHCSAQPPPPAWPGRAVIEPGRKTWEGPKPISVIGSTGSIGTQVNYNYYVVLATV